jgi:hypothetical protein
MERVTVRVSRVALARLDGLAADRGTTRSKLVREAVEALVAGEPLPPARAMAEEEILGLLRQRAREGNVSALRTLLAREESADPHRQALAAL